MDSNLIKTEADYRAALMAVDFLMAAKGNTPAGDRLDVLVKLIEAYEGAHFPMDSPDGRLIVCEITGRVRGGALP